MTSNIKEKKIKCLHHYPDALYDVAPTSLSNFTLYSFPAHLVSCNSMEFFWFLTYARLFATLGHLHLLYLLEGIASNLTQVTLSCRSVTCSRAFWKGLFLGSLLREKKLNIGLCAPISLKDYLNKQKYTHRIVLGKCIRNWKQWFPLGRTAG